MCLSSAENISSITFKPNGVGTIAHSKDEYISEAGMYVTISVETPFTYTKNKDKMPLKTNPLKSTVSVKPLQENVSQRKKDILENVKNKYTVEIHKEQPKRHNYTLYRIDDYMVLSKETGFGSLEAKFVSEEYQAQAEARKAAQAKAE